MIKEKLQKILKANKPYKFNTDSIKHSMVEIKGKERHYVEGYISTCDLDLYNDIVTPKALKSMMRQINESTITLDYEHESWRDDPTIIPVGKIISAKIDEKGLWVKAELNKNSPKFKDMWGSVKDGFINAFSIAFKPLKTVMKTMGDTEVRIIEELVLLNVALTGAPVNQNAKMTSFKMKDVMLKAINDMESIEGDNIEECILVPKSLIKEVKKMVEKKDEEVAAVESSTEETAEEAPAEEAPAEDSAKEEPAPEPVKEEAEASAEEPAVEEKATKKMLEDLKNKVEAQAKELKSLKETMVFKSEAPKEPEPEEPEVKSVLSMIK